MIYSAAKPRFVRKSRIGFYRTADCQIEDVISTPRQVQAFLKQAQRLGSPQCPGGGKCQTHNWHNLINPLVFNAVSSVYQISRNPEEYVYLVARAVAVDEPNNNGDSFPEEELLRFTLATNSLVYRTFQNDPLHVNHVADDPTKAKGFLPDTYLYGYKPTENPADKHVKCLVAADRTKDRVFAEALRRGEIKTFSMGAEVSFTICSVCGNRATTENEFCTHIKNGMKMRKVGAQLCFEKCFGVRFRELSEVGDPAWPEATTDVVLGSGGVEPYQFVLTQAQKRVLIEQMGVPPEDLQTIARYFDGNWDQMPKSVQRLAARLWS